MIGKVVSYRPLTITAPIYRCWATCRLENMQEWVMEWALPGMHAGVPSMGAVDAWREALTHIEELKLDNEKFSGGVADIANIFDQIIRKLVYKLAASAGMPRGVLRAYKIFLEQLLVYNCLAGGVGLPYRRKCGIPQGCPFSMMVVALIMRTWVIQMRDIGDVHCYILADDVLILATWRAMISKTAEAINTTHKYMQTMGARVVRAKATI